MLWQPLNLTEICPGDSPLLACSSFGYLYLSLVMKLFSGSRDIEKQKRHKQPDDSRDQFDFIVVGAGSAGCVVANRLSENPDWQVLLVEAGGEQPDVTLVPSFSSLLRYTDIVNSYTTEPDGKSCLSHPGGRCSWTVGNTMGGSSSTNNIAYVRGNKADYNEWAALGNRGWSYADVLPLFKKSEHNMNINDSHIDARYHGVSGEQYVSRYSYIDKPSSILAEAFKQNGLPPTDVNGARQVGSMSVQATILKNERVSTNTAFIQPIRYKRKNLTIKTHSEVIQILIDENKKAYGIVYIQNGEKKYAYAKNEVIVSAGALSSPKLLMLSGIGPEKHLKKLGIPVVQDLAVGENLHDHVTFNGIFIAFPNDTATRVSNEDMLREIEEYAKMPTIHSPLPGNGPSSTVAFLKTAPDLIAPDVQVHCRSTFDFREFLVHPITSERVQIFPTAYYDAILPRIVNVKPQSRGVLLLNESNPLGPPLLYANYFDDERDFDPLLRGIKYILTLEDTEAFKSSGAYFVREPMRACSNYVWGTDEYFRCIIKAYTLSIYHYVGTCKMGPKWDKKAVVDNELRVYGVCGLRVIDASIMPNIVRGNTNAASIMIGERGVDFVIKHWQKNNNVHRSC